MAWVPPAIAQALPVPPGGATCVDVTEDAVRRIVEVEPCKQPLAASVGAAATWPAYPARASHNAHPMFWRFPVQPVGPFDVPRHVRR